MLVSPRNDELADRPTHLCVPELNHADDKSNCVSAEERGPHSEELYSVPVAASTYRQAGRFVPIAT